MGCAYGRPGHFSPGVSFPRVLISLMPPNAFPPFHALPQKQQAPPCPGHSKEQPRRKCALAPMLCCGPKHRPPTVTLPTLQPQLQKKTNSPVPRTPKQITAPNVRRSPSFSLAPKHNLRRTLFRRPAPPPPHTKTTNSQFPTPRPKNITAPNMHRARALWGPKREPPPVSFSAAPAAVPKAINSHSTHAPSPPFKKQKRENNKQNYTGAFPWPVRAAGSGLG